MKKGFYFVLILCAACLMGSCSKTKSYTDMLNDEKKAISRLIDSLDIEVLKDFPDDSIFAENQFVKLDNGVYMNIIDRGEGRATLYSTKVMYRCEAYYFLNNFQKCLGNYGPNSNGTVPYPANGAQTVPFIYGEGTTSNQSDPKYYYVSEGIQTPLQYVGHHGRVKLIVPFDKGNYYDQGEGYPVYYEVLEYLFEDQL